MATSLGITPAFNGMAIAIYYFRKNSPYDVGDFIPWLSDHCPLRFTLECHQPKQNIEKESNMKDVPKQFIWAQEGITKFQKELNKIENTILAI